MKKVIFVSETNTVNAKNCHENDGMIYAAIIDSIPHLLNRKYDRSGWKWIEISKATEGKYFGGIDNNYSFMGAISRLGAEVTQLANLSELADWLKKNAK